MDESVYRKKENARRAVRISVMAGFVFIVVLAAVFGQTVFKSAMPKRYVGKAVSKTTTAMKVLQALRPLPVELLSGSYDQTIECGLKDFTSTDAVVNESYMAVLKAMKLTSKIRRDAEAGRLDGELSFGQGGVSLLGARMFFSEEEMALVIPQGFDYYITAEPKSFVDDWDQSTYGEFANMRSLLGNDFYRNYKELLFARETEDTEEKERLSGWDKLMKNASYQYQGRSEIKIGDGTRKVDLYQVVIKEEDAEACWETQFGYLLHKADAFTGIVTGGKELPVFQTFRPVGDVVCMLNVYQGAVVKAEVEGSFAAGTKTGRLSASLSLLGQKDLISEMEGTCDMQTTSGGLNIQFHSEGERSGKQISDATKIVAIQSNGERTDLGWELQWDKQEYTRNNFRFTADISADSGHMTMHVGSDGKVFEDREQKYAVWDMNDLRVNLLADGDEMAAEMSLRYDIKAGEIDEIGFDRESSIAFDKLSILDLLEIINRLDRDVGLGGFLLGE